eukprot:TRINITY_DN68999_c0_g2_i2.p1 TRINITY_DN68999_c0_g2~~TRINITY_DN68999_c0_g2_i2.p1  ORF type:complete len:228 (-),score=10.59 TRINITY_DN68999_c0_g2_i2:214-897(-)
MHRMKTPKPNNTSHSALLQSPQREPLPLPVDGTINDNRKNNKHSLRVNGCFFWRRLLVFSFLPNEKSDSHFLRNWTSSLVTGRGGLFAWRLRCRPPNSKATRIKIVKRVHLSSSTPVIPCSLAAVKKADSTVEKVKAKKSKIKGNTMAAAATRKRNSKRLTLPVEVKRTIITGPRGPALAPQELNSPVHAIRNNLGLSPVASVYRTTFCVYEEEETHLVADDVTRRH